MSIETKAPSEALKEAEEYEPKEVQRLELDPEKGMDIVIRERKGEKVTTKEVSRESYELSPARVVIEKDGEIIEDLGERFPDVIYFNEEKKHWEAPSIKDILQERHVVMMPGKWENVKDILSFLHELGHFRHFDKNPEFREKQKNVENLLGLMKLVKKKSEFEKNFSKDKSKEVITAALKLTAQRERGAWAEGLKLARELKRDKDIDLLKPFRNKKTNKLNWKELGKCIDSVSLGSYGTISRIFTEAGSTTENLRGIFTKKYKESFKDKIKISVGKTMLKLLEKS